MFIDNDPTVNEGDTARFEVKLTATSIVPVRVRYATMEDTAVEGTDYTAASGTLTFQPGQDSKTVDVRTRQDTADEPDTETFTLELSDPEDASLGDSTGTGTITDDDDPPEVSIGNAPAVTEGDTALFPVTLGVASGKMVTVMYRTMDGTAEDSSDYMATSGALEFEPGTTRLTVAVRRRTTNPTKVRRRTSRSSCTTRPTPPSSRTRTQGKERSGTTTTRSICRSRTRRPSPKAVRPSSR